MHVEVLATRNDAVRPDTLIETSTVDQILGTKGLRCEKGSGNNVVSLIIAVTFGKFKMALYSHYRFCRLARIDTLPEQNTQTVAPC